MFKLRTILSGLLAIIAMVAGLTVAGTSASATSAQTRMSNCKRAIAERPGWTKRALADHATITCVAGISSVGSDAPSKLPRGVVVLGQTTGVRVKINIYGATTVNAFKAIVSYEVGHAVDSAELDDATRTWLNKKIGAKQWTARGVSNFLSLGNERWAWTAEKCTHGTAYAPSHGAAFSCSLLTKALAMAAKNRAAAAARAKAVAAANKVQADYFRYYVALKKAASEHCTIPDGLYVTRCPSPYRAPAASADVRHIIDSQLKPKHQVLVIPQ